MHWMLPSAAKTQVRRCPIIEQLELAFGLGNPVSPNKGHQVVCEVRPPYKPDKNKRTNEPWGSGIFQENETWYAYDRGRLSEVLDFPGTGELAGPLQFAWQTKAKPRESDGSVDIIDIDYSVTLGTSLGDGIGGAFHHSVTFLKKTSSLKFAFDDDSSKITKSEFLSLYDVGSLTWQQWSKLVRLAAKDDPSFVDLFERVLTACRKADEHFWNCREIAEELKQ
jgi:hypothetical protein